MIFAKIDFINLLPLHVFIKKNLSSTQRKQIIEYKKSYPSAINKKFRQRKVDAAVISSIASRRAKTTLDLGIVAKGAVTSVLVRPGSYKKDFQSDTSNALAKVLGIEGEVIIGDKALYQFHNSDEEFIDLSSEWEKKYNLPFVFARLCVNKHEKYLKKLSNDFVNTKVFIPQYILEKYAKNSGLTKKQIKEYLTKIHYQIGEKEKRSLKLFLKLSKGI
ncbi:MAG: MqnA/MqnD/SBP family protein [Arcobacteraceae bacterium]